MQSHYKSFAELQKTSGKTTITQVMAWESTTKCLPVQSWSNYLMNIEFQQHLNIFTYIWTPF